MTVRSANPHQELVPLGERLRWMRMFRLAATGIIGLCFLALPEVFEAEPLAISIVTGGYLAFSFLAEATWRGMQRRGLPLFGAMLIVDGIYVAWASWQMTDPEAPLRLLVVVHIVTVTLLASFRTGVKLAMWHSLLLLTFFHLGEIGIMTPDGAEGGGPGGVEYRSLVGSISIFWIAGLATASFAAVNERELRRRRYDLEALAGLSDELERAEEAAAVTRALVEAVDGAFDFDRIVLLVPDRDEFVLVEHRRASVSGVSPRGPSTLAARALSGRETVLVTAARRESDPWLGRLLPSATNLVVLPLRADAERALGVLVCEHGLRSDSRIEQRVVAMLERFVSVTALCLSRLELLQRLQRTAATDGLTGVANRRTFDTLLGQEFARAVRTGSPLGLVMVDIDHFKRLNDTLGHLAGDHVLQEVAQGLDTASRATDFVARYGGEEFVVLLPGTDAGTAAAVAWRLHAAVAGSGRTAPVTASVGVAVYPDHAADGLALIEAADAALYEAKRSGRDRVVVSRAPDMHPVAAEAVDG